MTCTVAARARIDSRAISQHFINTLHQDGQTRQALACVKLGGGNHDQVSCARCSSIVKLRVTARISSALLRFSLEAKGKAFTILRILPRTLKRGPAEYGKNGSHPILVHKLPESFHSCTTDPSYGILSFSPREGAQGQLHDRPQEHVCST